MICGRAEPGYGWPLRFAYAAEVVNNLGYTETDDLHDWVPIGEIYDRYAEVWQDSPHGHQFPTLLCRQEFGKMLGHILFGEHVTRRIGSKTARGFAGITGPGARRIRSPKQKALTMEQLEKFVNDGTVADNERNTE